MSDNDTKFDPDAFESVAAFHVDEYLRDNGERAVPDEIRARLEAEGLSPELGEVLEARANEIYAEIPEFNDGSPDEAALRSSAALVMLRVLELEDARS